MGLNPEAAPSSLKFGTSGLRGLVVELNGVPAFAYTRAFAEMLKEDGSAAAAKNVVLVGRDLRESSPSIAQLCCAALQESGLTPLDCGALPTPALAYHGMRFGIPAIMVTGSHIPEDRNGLKFYRAQGEIDKKDEAAILAWHARLGITAVPETARGIRAGNTGSRSDRRLQGPLPRLLRGRGAGRSHRRGLPAFLGGPGRHRRDARNPGRAGGAAGAGHELHPGRHRGPARGGRGSGAAMGRRADARCHRLDRWRCGPPPDLRCTRAPSCAATWSGRSRPSLSERMRSSRLSPPTPPWRPPAPSPRSFAPGSDRLTSSRAWRRPPRSGAQAVVGFEANGGVLLGSDIVRDDRRLAALPTRDAMLPILCALGEIVAQGKPLAEIGAAFAFKAAASNRLQERARRTRAQPSLAGCSRMRLSCRS